MQQRYRRKTNLGRKWATGIEKVPRRTCILCGSSFYAPPVLVRRGGGKYCSNKCRVKGLAMNPAMYPQCRTKRGSVGKRTDLDGRFFRSSWEANYARYLNFLVKHKEIKAWDYECDTFEFPVKRGTRFYTPDFKVTLKSGKVEYHEIKGWMDPASATKLKRMAKYHKNVKMVLIDKTAYLALAKSVSMLIDNWEYKGKLNSDTFKPDEVKNGTAILRIREELDAQG